MHKRAKTPTESNNGKGWYKVIALVVVLVIAGWILREFFSGADSTGKIVKAPVTTPVTAPVKVVVEEPAAAIETVEVVSPAPPPVAASSASLALRGVFASPQREMSLAIIANDEGVERYFMLEDTVFDTAVLKEIHQYHVVILRNGQRRILRLSRDADEWEEEPTLEAKRGRLLADYRKAILTGDIDKFVGVAGYRPAYKGSDLYGFEIVSQGKKGDAFLGQTGLQHGDVVISINGHELATDFEYMQYLANNIKTMSDINIGVERGGTILFFTYTADASTGQEQPLQPPDSGESDTAGNVVEPEKTGTPANPILEELLKDD